MLRSAKDKSENFLFLKPLELRISIKKIVCFGINFHLNILRQKKQQQKNPPKNKKKNKNEMAP